MRGVNAFINLEPVQRSENGCDMRFWSKTVLNLLVLGDLLETQEDCSRESYSSQV